MKKVTKKNPWGILKPIANAVEFLEEHGDIKCNLPECGDVGCASSIIWSAMAKVRVKLLKKDL